MSSASKAAEKFFVENIRDYARTNPEKFNLSQGLANLAAAVDALENKVEVILQQLAMIQQQRH